MNWKNILKEQKDSKKIKEALEKRLKDAFKGMPTGYYTSKGDWKNEPNPEVVKVKINDFKKRYPQYFNRDIKLEIKKVEGKGRDTMISYSYGPLNETYSFKRGIKNTKQKPANLTQNQLDYGYPDKRR